MGWAKALELVQQQLDMEPFISAFNGRENTGIKVVKIINDKWFPHMRPELYSKIKIHELEEKFSWKRVNFSDWLPFA